MKRIKSILTLFCLIFGTSITSAETQDGKVAFDKDIILPYPSSYVFNKYSLPQPALSTGSIDIKVPIFELNYKNVKIPFTCCYNTSGIKVFEDAFPYGLGWVMTPGLRITRVIMGRPDEHYKHMSFNGNTTCTYDSLRTASFIIDSDHPIDPRFEYKDTQHDIFTVHLPDNSLTFLIEKQGDKYIPISGGVTNLKIEADTLLSYFNVVDGQGVKYHFANVYEYRDLEENRTSWMLDYIETDDGSRITFHWRYTTHGNEKELAPGVLFDSFGGNHYTDIPTRFQTPDATYSFQNYGPTDHMAHLVGIDYPLGRVSMEYKGREMNGLISNPLLSKLKVKNNDQETIKDVTFTYDSTYVLRHYLQSIDIQDEGVYTFEYDNTAINYHNRYSQDWWGYYNGKSNINSRIPKFDFLRFNNEYDNQGSFLEIGEADRSVDTIAMKAGIMTAINYPTGGRSLFEYEANRWIFDNRMQFREVRDSVFGNTVYGAGLRIKKITTLSGNGSPVVTSYTYGVNEDSMANCISMPLPHTFVNSQKLFNVSYPPSCFEDSDSSRLPEFVIFKYRSTTANASSSYMQYHFNEPEIWYSQVTEYKGGGKTVYHFNKLCPSNDIMTDWGGGVLQSLFTLSSKGILKTSEEVFSFQNGRYKKLSETKYNYTLFGGNRSFEHNNRDFYVKRKCGAASNPELNQELAPDITKFGFVMLGDIQPFGGNRGYSVPFSPEECYEAYPYNTTFFTERLNSVSHIEYTPSGNITTSKLYTYAPTNDAVISETTMVNNETKETITYSYPFYHNEQLTGFQSTMMDSLVVKNKIATPFKTTTNRNGASTSLLTEYGQFNGIILPEKQIFSRAGHDRVLREYDYDNKGNCTTLNLMNGTKTESYIWGYGKEYPVVAASGINRSTLDNQVGSSTINCIESATSQSSLDDAISSASDTTLVGAYTIKPLVGMTSSTSFNGIKAYYDYDTNQRLHSIADDNKTVVSQYSYGISSKPIRLNVIGDFTAFVGLEYVNEISSGLEPTVVEWNICMNGDTLTYSGSRLCHVFAEPGTATIKCNATDDMSKITATSTHQVVVNPEIIKFNILPNSTEAAPSATISNFNPVQVTFEIQQMLDRGTAYINLDGETQVISAASDNTITVNKTLDSGTHNFSITTSNRTSGTVILRILRVNGSHSETFSASPYLILTSNN